MKRSSASPKLRIIQRNLDNEDTSEENEDEDEETLQLRIQALEARLKLKKLQSKKEKLVTAKLDDRNTVLEGKAAFSDAAPSRSDRQGNVERPAIRFRPAESVQVPISPPRKPTLTKEPRSPGRVLLGIDKGLKGGNVSLRRPSTTRAPAVAYDDSLMTELRPRSAHTPSVQATTTSTSGHKTFSERVAETRQQDKEQKYTADRLRRQKSTGFGVQQQELDSYKNASRDQAGPNVEEQSTSRNKIEFSREEVLRSLDKPSSGLLHRSSTVTGVRNTRRQECALTTTSTVSSRRPLSSTSTRTTATSSSAAQSDSRHTSSITDSNSKPTTPQADSSLFEPFSSLHLSKRLLPHQIITRTLQQKTILLLPSLLHHVKSPEYSLPSSFDESDYVVFGIIASKSSPLTHKDAHKMNKTSSTSSSLAEAAESEQNAHGKYIVFTITDLKWSVDLYLFTTAYTRFWKLTPGTVIAILNPSIMPPPPGKADTGRFSLTLSSSDDTILEVGTSRDLGFCKAVKRDGKTCNSWVDKRHTDFCEWHVDRGVESCRRGRMEVQGMSAPFGPGGKGGGRTGFFGSRRGKKENGKDDGLLREGAQYDRNTSSRYFIAPSLGGRSAANLLDDEEGWGRGANKEERTRKRLANMEREKEVARKLGEGGNGMGGEYLRMRSEVGGGEKEGGYQRDEQREPVDAGALGLLGNKAGNVHLSPLKRKIQAVGSDGNSPRKKTRFVTAKGIREAGRESFGGAVVAGHENGLDDDDLDIV